jgi:hypothetical protein
LGIEISGKTMERGGRVSATSSFSYVFRLQYPRILHCRIVPIEKLKTLVALGRKKPPVNHLDSK